jgi:hypothetical protein
MHIHFSRRSRWILAAAAGTLALALLMGRVLAQGPEGGGDMHALGGSPTWTFTYQGRLLVDGEPVSGAYDFEFSIWDAGSGGNQIAASCAGCYPSMPVEEGFFTLNLAPSGASLHDVFNGGSRWIELRAAPAGTGAWQAFPRQPIAPAPYAWGLYPGTVVSGTLVGSQFGDAVFNVAARHPWGGPDSTALYARSTTDSAVRGESGGMGVYGSTTTSYGVRGEADTGTAGYFHSTQGYGVRADADGARIYDHGAYITSNMGYAVLAQSAGNMAVRGEAGNVSGISQPIGRVGVAGIGQDRGVYGSSSSGAGVWGDSGDSYGVLGESDNFYGGYFYSQNFRGLAASSPSDDYAGFFNNRGGASGPGLYVNGTLMVTGAKSGYVVDLAVNAGPDALETGDVVVIAGYADPVLGEIPVIQVRRADEAASARIAGVVDQPFHVPTQPASDAPAEDPPYASAALAVQSAGTGIGPGEYLSLVTLGAFKMVKVDADYGAIAPGDLLVSAPRAGYAMRAQTPAVGTVIGKALGELATGQGSLPVLVTLD